MRRRDRSRATGLNADEAAELRLSLAAVLGEDDAGGGVPDAFGADLVFGSDADEGFAVFDGDFFDGAGDFAVEGADDVADGDVSALVVGDDGVVGGGFGGVG